MMLLKIKPVEAATQKALASIWIPWLRDVVGLEPEAEDLRAMADPQGYYGQSGGEALLAFLDDEIVGGVALRGLGSSGFEFCKLVVTDAARGRGVGQALVQACLDHCQARSAALWLQSFHQLDVALSLYRKLGFKDAPPPPEMGVLKRTEVVMTRAPQTPEIALQ